VNLRLVALGHRMPAWVGAGYAEYVKRLPRGYAVELVELKPAPRASAKPVAQMLAAEALRVRAACAGYAVVALDERGEAWTTRQLAQKLQRFRDGARDVAFVIGSADGLDDGVKRDAAAVFALSALTLPHGLVRVVLAEQLYRAVSVLEGHPYHRE
jgi:23S rRNA (pseudouridine1915-N3)-methyltransferase